MISQSAIGKLDGLLERCLEGPEIWDEACDVFGEIFRSDVVVVSPIEARSWPAGLPMSRGAHEPVRAFDAGGWSKLSPRLRNLPLMLRQGHLVDHDFIGDAEIEKDQYYNEFLQSLDLRWFMGIPFAVGEARYVLSLNRSSDQGAFSSSEIEVGKLLAEPLARATGLTVAFGGHCTQCLEDVLAASGRLTLLISDQGTVFETNADGATLKGHGLKIVNGRLQTIDRRPDVSQLVEAALAARRGGSGNRPSGRQVVGLANGASVMVEAFPLPRTAAFALRGAGAIVTARFVARDAKASVLRSSLGLSERESAVAAMLAQGLRPAEIAQQLGVAVGTVRNHLHWLYVKTHTASQGQLISLISKLLG